jgi:hypothetical protein
MIAGGGNRGNGETGATVGKPYLCCRDRGTICVFPHGSTIT